MEKFQSVLRQIISGENIPISPSDGSAFCFLVPIEKVTVNRLTAHLDKRTGELQLWEGKQ